MSISISKEYSLEPVLAASAFAAGVSPSLAAGLGFGLLGWDILKRVFGAPPNNSTNSPKFEILVGTLVKDLVPRRAFSV